MTRPKAWLAACPAIAFKLKATSLSPIPPIVPDLMERFASPPINSGRTSTCASTCALLFGKFTPSPLRKTLHLKAVEGDATYDRVFKFRDLENPTALLQELAGPWAFGALEGIGLGNHSSTATSTSLGIKWEASRDSIDVRHASVHAYRLRTRLLERYQIVIFVSRVGEILRVELPDQIVLTNDQLFSY